MPKRVCGGDPGHRGPEAVAHPGQPHPDHPRTPRTANAPTHRTVERPLVIPRQKPPRPEWECRPPVFLPRRAPHALRQACPLQGGTPREPVRQQAPASLPGRTPPAAPAPPPPPRRHALRAHLTAPPARHRRRGRHERIHRGARPAPRRDQHRGRDLHARDDGRSAAGRRDGPRRPGPPHRRGPLRGPQQGGPPRPAVRLHARCDAGLGRSPPRLLRPGPLALLALRPRRLARRPALGHPLVHAMHTMAKVKNANLADGDTPSPPPASSARPRSSPPPTASSRTPPRSARNSSSTTQPTPARSPSCTPA